MKRPQPRQSHAARFCILAVILLTLGASPVLDSRSPQLSITVNRGLAYLARQQQPDGSFTGFEDNAPRGQTAAKVLLAMLAAGNTPTDGQHALVVHNAIGYLVRESSADGYFGQTDGSGMSGEDWMTLALAESYGMEGDPSQRRQIAALLHSALDAILAMQDRAGGWNEQAQGEGTLATTALTVLTLDSLRGAGFTIPQEAMNRAAAFAKSCQHGSTFADRAQQPTPASTAAGACILLITHASQPADLKDTLKYLLDHRLSPDAPDFPLAAYEASLAHLYAADLDWPKHWQPIWDQFRKTQGEDGSWFSTISDDPTANGVALTADTLLTLTIPYGTLPAYRGAF